MAAILALLSCSGKERDQAEDAGSTVQSVDSLPQPAEEGNRVYRGYAVHGLEVRSFQLCQTEETLWTEVRTGLLWTLHKDLVDDVESYQEIFAVVTGWRGPPPEEGFGAEYAGTLHVEEVLYAGIEGPGCDTEWDRYQYRIFGIDPFWSAEVSSRGIWMIRPEKTDVTWEDVSWEEVEGGVRLFGETGTEEGPYELIILPGTCRDPITNGYFGLVCVLRVDGEEFTGCVLKGAEPGPQPDVESDSDLRAKPD